MSRRRTSQPKELSSSLVSLPALSRVLTTIPGLVFNEAWENRVESDENGIFIPYLGKADLILAKQAAGRLQDLADIEEILKTDH